jgi:hypothetical protein
MSNVLKMLSRGGAAAAETDPNFKQTVLLLHGDGTNGAQNNTFLDGSTNNFTITRNGNTTQGTFSPFSLAAGEWSNYFDGSGDYLDAGNQTAHNFDGQFTVEAWVYRTVGSTNQAIAGKWALNNDAWLILIGSNNTIIFYYESFNITTTATIPLNAWCHVAVTRDSSNNIRIFVDGVQTGSTTNSSANISGTASLTIGAYNATGSITSFLTGYISNLRVVKGTAVYTSSFTPPTAPLTAITNTSLLTCQSNRFVDNSTNAFAITRNGDVRVTPFSPFAPSAAYSAGTNGGSGYFDGTGDYLTVADNAAFDLSGDFTIEFVAYATGANNRRFLQLGDYRSPNNGLVIYTNASNALVVYVNGATIITGSAFPLNQWVYVALVRSGGGSNNLKLYMNAVQDGQATNTVSFTGVAGNGVAIGAEYGGSYAATAECYISTVRIVNGTALTPAIPTAPLTAITNTSILLNFTNAGIFDNTGKNNLETVGNAQIDTTVKKYGTGSMEFDGSGDRLTNNNFINPDLIMGTGSFTIEGWLYTTSTANMGLLQISTTAGGLQANNTNNIAVYCNNLVLGAYYGGTFRAGTTSISSGTWTHFALVRNGSSINLYVNGTADSGFGTQTDNQNYTGGYIVVGGYFGTSNLFNGYIDDLRITKGVARYIANFTAPTKEFPDQ